MKIPQDVAVVGYDNQQIASESFPALTSVELPYSDMGKLAIESLMALIEGQPLLSNKRKVEGELIVRTSSTKTKGGHIAHHNTQSRWSYSIAAAASSKGRSAI